MSAIAIVEHILGILILGCGLAGGLIVWVAIQEMWGWRK